MVKIQKTNVPMGTPFCQENAVRVAQRKKKRHFFEPFFLFQKSAFAAAKQRKRQKSWGGNNSAGEFLSKKRALCRLIRFAFLINV